MIKFIKTITVFLGVIFLVGCAQQTPYDYTNFKAHQPKSILVLLPTNNSPEVNASFGVLAQTTYPLAEAGYYVYPVAVVNEIFAQNGVTNGADVQSVNPEKLKQIFGADSALYITVTDYGTSYKVISSDTRVTVDAKLVDLASGQLLWSGKATASSTEGESSSGLLSRLISAAYKQIVNSLTDKSYEIAGIADNRLLSPEKQNGILYGHRSPKYTNSNAQ